MKVLMMAAALLLGCNSTPLPGEDDPCGGEDQLCCGPELGCDEGFHCINIYDVPRPGEVLHWCEK